MRVRSRSGWHLGILGRMLELFCSCYGDAAVFIDFCSLYQLPRDDIQQAKFKTRCRCWLVKPCASA